MASLNSILHTVAEVLPFRSEAEQRQFHADIDDVSPVPAEDDDSTDADATDVKGDAKPAAPKPAAPKSR